MIVLLNRDLLSVVGKKGVPYLVSNLVDVVSQLKKKAAVYVTWLLVVLSKDASAE